MHKKRAGNGSSPPPALHFLGFDDRIQQRQLLTGGAVQRFKALIHGCRVDISYPPCQFLFPCFGFGIVYDHMDRGHFSDSGHLFLHRLRLLRITTKILRQHRTIASAAGWRVFSPIRAVWKIGNTPRIPLLSKRSAEEKSLATDSCRIVRCCL